MQETGDRRDEGGWSAARRASRPASTVHVSPGDGVRWVILSAAPASHDEDEAERSETTTRAVRRGR